MSDAKLPDSSNLAAWEKAAAKSAPNADGAALTWTTPEGVAVTESYWFAWKASYPKTAVLELAVSQETP